MNRLLREAAAVGLGIIVVLAALGAAVPIAIKVGTVVSRWL